MRAEADICSAAGLTDSQLHTCLSNSVNEVLDLQNSWAKATAI